MSTRPPRKYRDKDRTEVNPAWLEWRDRLAKAQREVSKRQLGIGYDASLFPEDYGKDIPDEGCWVRIIEEPFTELQQRFRVPVMSVWRATPYVMNSGGYHGRRPRLARIVTPGGELCLWPHEYDIWDDVTWLVGQEPDVVMHTLGGKPLIDEDQLFYLMKAGVNQHDAAMLMLNNLEQQDLVWFEFAPFYVEAFGTVGRPLWRHMQLNPRENNKPFKVTLKVTEGADQ